MSELIETPIEEDTNKSTGLAVELDVYEMAVLLDLLAPQCTAGTKEYIVDLFIKLHRALRTLQPEEDRTMPAGEKSYKAAHIPDRASGDMTKQSGGHAEPATKKPMREKTVGQVMEEAPHMPAPRDHETGHRGHRGTSIKTNAGS